MEKNPLLQESFLPLFKKIKVEHMKPALETVLKDAEKNFQT